MRHLGVFVILLLTLSSVGAFAVTLNSKFGLSQVNPGPARAPGVVQVYKLKEGEVLLKSVPISDDTAAIRAVEVGFGLIKGLYEPKKNPYAGEVTSLVQCDRQFAPREFSFKCPSGRVAKGIVGGTGARHAFGMCRKDDISQVGAFFSCYDPAAQELVEVRLFVPFVRTKKWSQQLRSAESLAREILQ